jgi:hypothetical protein
MSRPHRIKEIDFVFIKILWGRNLKAVQIGSFDQLKVLIHAVLLTSTMACFTIAEHKAFRIIFENHPFVAMVASGILIIWLYYWIHRDLH